ncbi:hypothetical protein EHI45_23445 [Rhizobium leguminosarum]|jgi:hypothetical protein|uniref:hypothetical protein n=1 Tax=Rhizobium leguminosarum TaxID=384 RepID=UPI000FEC57CD|nr:hypothetical protein [Rhizobium leguminosarum]RWX08898.1 hypothetical protein EHI45_23445 [Rhizobium leguminosarum]
MTTTPIVLSSNADREARNGNSGVAGSGTISSDGTRDSPPLHPSPRRRRGRPFRHLPEDLVTGAVTLLSDAAGAGNASLTPD